MYAIMGIGLVTNTSLEQQIGVIKYTAFWFNCVAWIFSIALFVLSVWLRADSGFNDWLFKLDTTEFYYGLNILIVVSFTMLAGSFLGCVSALMENQYALFIFAGAQIVCFLVTGIGAGLLLQFSTVDSSLQPLLYRSLNYYVSTSEYAHSQSVLNMIQDNVGCCGATGPWDYLDLRQPLPTSCRDTVSGNAFFNGCVDELTWFFEGKSYWIVGIALALAFLNVIDTVLSFVLIQALRKEEDEARNYRH